MTVDGLSATPREGGLLQALLSGITPSGDREGAAWDAPPGGGLFAGRNNSSLESVTAAMTSDFKVTSKLVPTASDLTKLSAPYSMGFLYLGSLFADAVSELGPGTAGDGDQGVIGSILERLGIGPGLTGGGAMAPVLRSLGRVITNPAVLAVAGTVIGATMAIRDGLAGMEKAEEWQVGEGAAFLGGAIAGTSSGWPGAARNAIKGAGIGAGLGFLIGGPIGAGIGAVVGGAIGGVLGAIGGERLANMFEDIKDDWNTMIDDVRERWARLRERWQESALGQWVGRTFGEDGTLSAWTDNANTNISEAISNFNTSINGFFENMGEGIRNSALGEAVSNFMNDFQGAIQGLRSQLPEWATRDKDGDGIVSDDERWFPREDREPTPTLADQADTLRDAYTSGAPVGARGTTARPIAPGGRVPFTSIEDGVFELQKDFPRDALFRDNTDSPIRFHQDDELYLMASTNPARDRLNSSVEQLNSMITQLAAAIEAYRPVTNNNTSVVESTAIPYRDLMKELP